MPIFPFSAPIIFSGKGILVQNKLETCFLSLILYLWTWVFFCLQRHACFVVIAFVVLTKELIQDRSSSAEVSFLCSYAVTCQTSQWFYFSCTFICCSSLGSFSMLLNIPIFSFVQAKTLPLVIAFFTVVILFILCVRKSQLCLPLVKAEYTDLLFILFFRRSPRLKVF